MFYLFYSIFISGSLYGSIDSWKIPIIVSFFPRILSREESTPRFPIEIKPEKTQDKSELDYRRNEWYVIGRTRDFKENKPYEIIIKNQKYVFWKNENREMYALENKCLHRGARLSDGTIDQNCVVCPYHHAYYNHLGVLVDANILQNISRFPIIEKNEWIYLGPKQESWSEGIERKPNIYTEREYQSTIEPLTQEKHRLLFLEIDYDSHILPLMDFLLDLFSSEEVDDSRILQVPRWISRDNLSFHAQMIYQIHTNIHYLSRQFFGENYFLLEKEMVFPYTLITKIGCGEYKFQMITSILPISEKKNRLFVKIYRNFWKNTIGDILVKMATWQLLTREKPFIEKIELEDGLLENRTFYYKNEKWREFYHRFSS